MSNTSDKYHDLRSLAKFSCISVPALRNYIKTDGLPCYRVRGKLLIRESEFNQWMAQFKVADTELDEIVDRAVRELSE